MLVASFLLAALYSLALLLMGLGLSYWAKARRMQSLPPQSDRGDDDPNDDGPGGFDPDAPLDLPPGVYVLPPEPVLTGPE